MVRMSEHLAARAGKVDADLPAQTRAVYRFALGREPTAQRRCWLLTELREEARIGEPVPNGAEQQ